MKLDQAKPGIDALTGFRFIAAAMVYLSHWPIPGSDGTLLKTITQNGYSGVTFFYVLSGFILAYTYLDRFQSQVHYGDVCRFYLNRFARVYPMYALSIVAALCNPYIPKQDPTLGFLAVQAWSSDLWVAYGPNPVGWSISVEVFLYLIAPFVMFGLSRAGALRSNRAALWWGVGLLAALGAITFWFYITGKGLLLGTDPRSSHRWLYRTPVLRIFDFAVGVLAASYFMRSGGRLSDRWVAFWKWAGYAAIAGTLIQMSFASFYAATFSFDFGYLIPGVVLILSLAICPRSLISRLLGSRLFLMLGATSYALYLFQSFAPGWTTRRLADIGIEFQNPAMAYAVRLIGTLIIAILMQRFIEEPCRRLIRRMAPSSSKATGRAPISYP